MSLQSKRGHRTFTGRHCKRFEYLSSKSIIFAIDEHSELYPAYYKYDWITLDGVGKMIFCTKKNTTAVVLIT